MITLATVVVVRGCAEPGVPLDPVGPELRLHDRRIEVEGSWFGLRGSRRFSAPMSGEVVDAILLTREERHDGRPAGLVVGPGALAAEVAWLDHALEHGVAARREGDERWWAVEVEPGAPTLSADEELLPRWHDLAGDELRWSTPPSNGMGGIAGRAMAVARRPRPVVDLGARVTPDTVILDLDAAFRLTSPAPLQGELVLSATDPRALERDVRRWSHATVGWARLVGAQPLPARLVVDVTEDTPLSVVAAVTEGFASVQREGLVELRSRFGTIELHDRAMTGPRVTVVIEDGLVDLREGWEPQDPRPCLSERCLSDGLALAAALPSELRLTLSARGLTVAEAWGLLVELSPDALGRQP